MVARELIPDRATIQVGVGSTSEMLMYALGGHHDLGMATEVIPRGTVPLVREGIVTGKFKKMMPGVVTASAFSPVISQEEAELADGDMRFHLYDFNFTDDVRVIAREDGLIAVNNAIAVDFGGQAASEPIGTRMFSGTGGQTVFAIGACLAGGLSIIVLPSSSMVKGRRVSRIVPVLEPGSVVTATRSSVHYVVTEHGIADLRGKSVPERARELIAIAHPDFRARAERGGVASLRMNQRDSRASGAANGWPIITNTAVSAPHGLIRPEALTRQRTCASAPFARSAGALRRKRQSRNAWSQSRSSYPAIGRRLPTSEWQWLQFNSTLVRDFARSLGRLAKNDGRAASCCCVPTTKRSLGALLPIRVVTYAWSTGRGL